MDPIDPDNAAIQAAIEAIQAALAELEELNLDTKEEQCLLNS